MRSAQHRAGNYPHFTGKGVERLILNANVQAVSSKEGAVQVETPEGARILMDCLLVASGRNRRRLVLQLQNRRGGIERTRQDRKWMIYLQVPTAADNVYLGDGRRYRWVAVYLYFTG